MSRSIPLTARFPSSSSTTPSHRQDEDHQPRSPLHFPVELKCALLQEMDLQTILSLRVVHRDFLKIVDVHSLGDVAVKLYRTPQGLVDNLVGLEALINAPSPSRSFLEIVNELEVKIHGDTVDMMRTMAIGLRQRIESLACLPVRIEKLDIELLAVGRCVDTFVIQPLVDSLNANLPHIRSLTIALSIFGDISTNRIVQDVFQDGFSDIHTLDISPGCPLYHDLVEAIQKLDNLKSLTLRLSGVGCRSETLPWPSTLHTLIIYSHDSIVDNIPFAYVMSIVTASVETLETLELHELALSLSLPADDVTIFATPDRTGTQVRHGFPRLTRVTLVDVDVIEFSHLQPTLGAQITSTFALAPIASLKLVVSDKALMGVWGLFEPEKDARPHCGDMTSARIQPQQRKRTILEDIILRRRRDRGWAKLQTLFMSSVMFERAKGDPVVDELKAMGVVVKLVD